MTEKSYMYLLKHKTLPYWKIGKTNNIKSRMPSLGLSNFDIESSYIFSVDGSLKAHHLERTLHYAFDDHRLPASVVKEIVSSASGHTEWFSVQAEDLLSVVEGVKSVYGVEESQFPKLSSRTPQEKSSRNYYDKAFLKDVLKDLYLSQKVVGGCEDVIKSVEERIAQIEISDT